MATPAPPQRRSGTQAPQSRCHIRNSLAIPFEDLCEKGCRLFTAPGLPFAKRELLQRVVDCPAVLQPSCKGLRSVAEVNDRRPRLEEQPLRQMTQVFSTRVYHLEPLLNRLLHAREEFSNQTVQALPHHLMAGALACNRQHCSFGSLRGLQRSLRDFVVRYATDQGPQVSQSKGQAVGNSRRTAITKDHLLLEERQPSRKLLVKKAAINLQDLSDGGLRLSLRAELRRGRLRL
mmetsp:Transcript_34714/g.81031  ORF Transcript_34714/g.81031 Transcript_34714/m.81031 type:complete len:233 (+) Transcript_34714:1250-1948(+)